MAYSTRYSNNNQNLIKMCMVVHTCDSRTWKDAQKIVSWGDLETVGQKGPCDKQTNQINPRTLKQNTGSMQPSS